MEDASGHTPIELRFSSRTLRGSNLIAEMKEYIGREMIRCEIDVADEEMPFEYRIALRSMPEAAWGRTAGTPMSIRRTTELMSDGNDDLMLVLTDSLMGVETERDHVAIKPGEAFVLSLARAATVRLPQAATGWSVRLPRRALVASLPHLGEAPFIHLPKGAAGLDLLGSYLHITPRAQLGYPALRALTGRHIQDLSALLIGASGDYAEQMRKSSARAVRLQLLLTDMRDHIGYPGLSLGWLAKRHNLSPRQIQRLFAAQEKSFSDELRLMRVTAARRMLEDPRQAGRPILAIALDCGFPEASALNRAFRQVYGVRPSDVRPDRRGF